MVHAIELADLNKGYLLNFFIKMQLNFYFVFWMNTVWELDGKDQQDSSQEMWIQWASSDENYPSVVSMIKLPREYILAY